VWYLTSETVHEHTWAAALRSLPGASIPVPRFGASDCRCETHLLYFPQVPDFDAFRMAAGQALRQWVIELEERD
jgi:Uri superfamily endonuclease